MNAPRADVLAVLDRQLKFTVASDYSGASQDHRDMVATRAAVSELIEAAKNASAILGHAYHTQIHGELEHDAHDAYQRLDAAIARVGSAA